MVLVRLCHLCARARRLHLRQTPASLPRLRCACQGLVKTICKRDGTDKDEAEQVEQQVAEGGGPAGTISDYAVNERTPLLV